MCDGSCIMHASLPITTYDAAAEVKRRLCGYSKVDWHDWLVRNVTFSYKHQTWTCLLCSDVRTCSCAQPFFVLLFFVLLFSKAFPPIFGLHTLILLLCSPSLPLFFLSNIEYS